MSFEPCRRQVIGLGIGIASATLLSGCAAEKETLELGTVLARVEDVPEGGAIPVLIGEVPVLLSHAPGGSFRAFSAICPHQGCMVLPPEEDEPEIMVCPCHRSRFNTFTGDVLNGPAAEGLGEIPVTVKDGSILVA